MNNYGIEKAFLSTTSNPEAIKEYVDKLDKVKSINFIRTKYTINKDKRLKKKPSLEESVAIYITDKGLISVIYKELL